MERHWTLLKAILNPILRKFGWSIVSIFDENEKFIKYQIREYPKYCGIPKKKSMKELWLDSCKTTLGKELFTKFFDETKNLYHDMDALSYREFKIREDKMWELRNEADRAENSISMIDLFGMADKAERLYANDIGFKTDKEKWMFNIMAGDL